MDFLFHVTKLHCRRIRLRQGSTEASISQPVAIALPSTVASTLNRKRPLQLLSLAACSRSTSPGAAGWTYLMFIAARKNIFGRAGGGPADTFSLRPSNN